MLERDPIKEMQAEVLASPKASRVQKLSELKLRLRPVGASALVRFLEIGLLRVGRFGLVLGFPLGKRHAVEGFASLVLAHLDTAFDCSFLIPAAKAISTKPA